MVMWLRIGGALLVTLAVMAALDYFGVGSMLGGRDQSPPDVSGHGEFFWFMIFSVVMIASVLAAVRRWAGRLRLSLAPPSQLKRG